MYQLLQTQSTKSSQTTEHKSRLTGITWNNSTESQFLTKKIEYPETSCF